jgi:hypothetical protein
MTVIPPNRLDRSKVDTENGPDCKARGSQVLFERVDEYGTVVIQQYEDINLGLWHPSPLGRNEKQSRFHCCVIRTTGARTRKLSKLAGNIEGERTRDIA